QDPALRRPGAMAAWLPRLMRERGAVLNTRRFARAETRVGGRTLRRGDVAVVGLREHGFGHGPHRCPGQRVALTIAGAALETLLPEPGLAWPTEWRILALPNANVPVFKESPR
ncbi:MAG TPA: hypothetical protein VHH36_01075, partial [Candidatus Thermoplasmatota archaeon]|nr:hypothetical protein [Candidatus Thermoplasmatota archaeon]